MEDFTVHVCVCVCVCVCVGSSALSLSRTGSWAANFTKLHNKRLLSGEPWKSPSSVLMLKVELPLSHCSVFGWLAYLSLAGGWTAQRTWGTWRNSWWWRLEGVQTEAALQRQRRRIRIRIRIRIGGSQRAAVANVSLESASEDSQSSFKRTVCNFCH